MSLRKRKSHRCLRNRLGSIGVKKQAQRSELPRTSQVGIHDCRCGPTWGPPPQRRVSGARPSVPRVVGIRNALLGYVQANVIASGPEPLREILDSLDQLVSLGSRTVLPGRNLPSTPLDARGLSAYSEDRLRVCQDRHPCSHARSAHECRDVPQSTDRLFHERHRAGHQQNWLREIL